MSPTLCKRSKKLRITQSTAATLAKDNGRAFIGIELNPEYGELAAKRTGGNLFINYGSAKKHEW